MSSNSAVPVPLSYLDTSRDAEPATRAANAAMSAKLPAARPEDFEAAQRGLIAPVPEGLVRAANGTVVWNLGEYAFVDGELAPATRFLGVVDGTHDMGVPLVPGMTG